MSKWLADYLKNNNHINPSKVHHVGGGSNIYSKKINYSRKVGNKFLFVGVDWERKNGPLVLKSFIEFNKKFPNTELHIAGPENLSTIMHPNIYFCGNLNPNQLTDLYNKCDIFVMPSKFEVYGLVFAAALIFGLPCIGKNIYAMKEFIDNEENGLLIEHDSIYELTNAMENLYLYLIKFRTYVISRKKMYLKKIFMGLGS